MTAWPPSLITAIRAELAGNTRDDLLHWARRVLRKPPTKGELAKARLVLELDDKPTKPTELTKP